ncbi:BREX system serine/threonine kinase PglW [Rhodocyclus purpureus]|uniref:BREX system serine/threonine kinase PglW n=1 Tax=Rhodocyclus purpureus TaxID=1067 RepID=UPI0019141337|nr:BREX system serine/threonine kinase PglW [Rhodocyclus purpureus]MBK5914701.1 protein kinase [Rhodocyclus purpureus]
MSVGASRWHAIAESGFAWEREALDWLREQLPDREPWHVWSNFEFIDDQGKVNEVDALVLSPAGLFLVEIKSRPGRVSGDAHSWTWVTDGQARTIDNPLLLADRKAKRLASLLRRQPAIVKAKIRLPFVEPLVFVSATALDFQLSGSAAAGVFRRGQPRAPADDGIVGALAQGLRGPLRHPVDHQQARAITRGLTEAGVRPSNKHRQVGDYELVKLIAEGDGYQDWQVRHVSVDTVQRRVRIYTIATASSPEERSARARQARREFEVLEGIDHPGILRCNDYKDSELGPALIFDHDPAAVRLDHLISERGQLLTVDQRLQLVRDLAEALKYAHGKRLYHRALGPQSVLVRADGNALKLQLMNWQTAARDVDADDTVHRTTGTRHVEAYVEDPGLVYLAPETTRADPAHGAELDVFSLGCLTWLIFSGRPPAANTLELAVKLREGQGLRLSDVMDGCGKKLQELVQYATHPDVLGRYDSIQGFLADLEAVEDELTTPDPEATVDPSDAGKGDRLEGGFTVVTRLGRGSSSVALLVQDGNGEEFVLKVANDLAHSDNLQAEGEALAKLRHPNVVEYRQTVHIAGRTALLLKSAGEDTLAEKLRDGRLSLDLLRRFGEELIEAVRHLEDKGVIHRDIKPDNIGISGGRGGKLQLVLFDFSLCRTPAENLTAGTPPYLDPFLPLRPGKRWDLYAERFAVAVTLYEMAVGKAPRWGDGASSPALIDQELKFETGVFDPVIREPLDKFFSQALARDFRERFDNAEDMLRDWRRVFEALSTTHPTTARGFEAIAFAANADTTMVELGYSLEARDVLERMGIHNVRELLAVDRIRFRYLRGVGDKIRKEIRLKAKELARLRPDLSQGRGTLHDTEEGGKATDKLAISINELARQLLPRRPAGDDRPEEAALAFFLGLDDAEGEGSPAGSAGSTAQPRPAVPTEVSSAVTTARRPAGTWPALGEAATAYGLARKELTDTLLKARERWLKNPAFTELRNQLDTLLHGQGQVMTSSEAALALLALRGCAEQRDDERLRLAGAVLRAAIEAESHLEKPRFELFDHAATPLVATSAAWADYARQLGAVADTCALSDPLLPPARVMHAVESIRPPVLIDDETTDLQRIVPPTRLLRLATAASRSAALSSRQEIYPRNMPAVQALRQSLGALVSLKDLEVVDLKVRVRGRFPDAEPLPERPSLDRLLEEVDAPFRWDEAARVYRRTPSGGTATAGTTVFRRLTTVDGLALADAAVQDALALEDRLQRNLRQGGLLVLCVEPRLAAHAESELLHRFGRNSAAPLVRLSFDALLIRALREQAETLRIDWNVILRADAAARDSRDWANLQRLVQRTLPGLRQRLLHSAEPLLLVAPGLLARYGLMSLVSEVEAQVGRPGCTPALWLLLPTRRQGLPTLDGAPVPLVNAGTAAEVPQSWVENRHRAILATQS